MQRVGGRLAEGQGPRIHSVIGDVHELPFPDNHFDVVTLQWATRHLRALKVFSEIRRVLRPGGRFHHCDMLRPRSEGGGGSSIASTSGSASHCRALVLRRASMRTSPGFGTMEVAWRTRTSTHLEKVGWVRFHRITSSCL